MKIGYARVSTLDQNLDAQLDALKAEGCERVYTEMLSASKERPQLEAALDHCRKGDTFVITKLDRLGRSVRQLIDFAHVLEHRGIHLRIINEGIDTASPTGRMLFVILGAFAELELSLIRERTRAGLIAARARGRKGGRPAINPDKIRLIRAMHENPSFSISDIMKTLDVSKGTIYKYLKK